MESKIGKGILLGWVGVHLGLVTLGASYYKFPDWMPGKSLIQYYGKASGADSNYGFFAPSIGMKINASFDIVKNNGEKISDIPLISDSQREEHIRLGGVFEEFTSEDANDANFRQPLAASLAAAMFTRYPDAKEVVFHVKEFWQKSMAEYRQGQREKWADYYNARFARNEK